MVKKTMWFTAFAAVAVLGVMLWPAARATSVARGEYVVRRGDLVIEAPVSGAIAAARSVDLTAPISSDPHFFKIVRIAPEGSRTEPGQMVLELDAHELEQKLAEYAAELSKFEEEQSKRKLEYEVQIRDLRVAIEEAKVAAEKARHKLEGPAELMSGNERRIFKIEAEQAETDARLLAGKLEAAQRMAQSEFGGLETMIANARSRMEQAERRRIACAVKAPIAGTLVYKVMADGTKRKVGEQTCHHEVILQIPDLSTLFFEAVVEENDAGRVARGQTVRIRVDAMPDESLTGTIASVGSVLRIKRPDVPVKVVDVVVTLDRHPGRLAPGMTSTGRVEIGRAPNALLIPLKAVQRKDQETFVRLAGPRNAAVERAVKLGRRSQELVEVLEGLSEGERLFL